jgi:hypothetical protein
VELCTSRPLVVAREALDGGESVEYSGVCALEWLSHAHIGIMGVHVMLVANITFLICRMLYSLGRRLQPA